MYSVRRSTDRGHATHGWLDSYHTFSFADYHDPDFMGFRVLRVINEDRVQPDSGFGTHPHKDMEIISYVVAGELEHKDSMGNGSVIPAGEFQIISAGSGITHSEFNPSKTNLTHFYQIWILPKEKGLTPRYQQRAFSNSQTEQPLVKVASSQESEETLRLNQDVELYLGSLGPGVHIPLPLERERFAWVQLVDGDLAIDGGNLRSGDGMAIQEEHSPSAATKEGATFLFFDLP